MKSSALAFSYCATGDREITLMREFAAPRHRVFEAITTPELVRRWFGEPGLSLEGEIKPGSEWRSVDTAGKVAMRGHVRELVPPERFVSTESTLGAPPYPGEVLATCVLAEQDGKTVFVETFGFESQAARDIAIESGLEAAYRKAFAILDEMLAAMSYTPSP